MFPRGGIFIMAWSPRGWSVSSRWFNHPFRRRWRDALLFLLFLAGCVSAAALPEAPVVDGEPPRIRALLEQGWSAEKGQGLNRNAWLAAALYRQAGSLGSAEGYYRAALIYLPRSGQIAPSSPVPCLLAQASQLGHQGAAAWLENTIPRWARPFSHCREDADYSEVLAQFDIERYIAGQVASRREIAGLIRRLAPRYAVDGRLALAIAVVESNLHPTAVSPKSAMGVMQLIPATAERFGVSRPFDPEQNVRGGLAYLRWLKQYYDGDVIRMVAAYNAGEKAVDAHGGIPPYPETIAYVARVLQFSAHRVVSGRDSGGRANVRVISKNEQVKR